MRISTHYSDWCHVCGERTFALADVFYSKNAEHFKDESKYVRICRDCISLMDEVSDIE